LSLEVLDKEFDKRDEELNVGIGTEDLTPKDYETVRLKNGYQAYYEKEAFCEPLPCQKYIIVQPGKVIKITILPEPAGETLEGIQHFLDTFKFTK
jgi:hypothetical protein